MGISVMTASHDDDEEGAASCAYWIILASVGVGVVVGLKSVGEGLAEGSEGNVGLRFVQDFESAASTSLLSNAFDS